MDNLKVIHLIPLKTVECHEPQYNLELEQSKYDIKLNDTYDGTTYISTFNDKSETNIIVNFEMLNNTEKTSMDLLKYGYNFNNHILFYDDEDFDDFSYLTLADGELQYTETDAYLYNFSINLKEL
jgi:hypothetical protein